MKEALIVTCNYSYDYGTRIRFVKDVLEIQGYDVRVLISDFDHRKKEYRSYPEADDINYIHVRPYIRNLSIQRIISHIQFAIGVKNYLSKRSPELIYHCAPPNSTISVISDVRSKKEFRLITEIGDMWPETMPIPDIVKRMLSLPFALWARMRDKKLYNSDVVITECDLFRDILQKKTSHEQIHTMYFCKEYDAKECFDLPPISNSINLCYLGSINNIVDISTMGRVIKVLSRQRRVVVHIIGDGERHDELIKMIHQSGGVIVDHGVVFDENEKKEIISKCHFGLNMMISQVCVGMTMKSLDYFSYGLPMLNNITGDGWEILERTEAGFNIDLLKFDVTMHRILQMNMSEYMKMRASVKVVHEEYFDVSHFKKKFIDLLSAINDKRI